MPQVVDQLNRIIQVPEKIESIVSLVPSQTELLFYLGLQPLVKGVTKFCIHPSQAKSACQIIGGTKSIHFDKIQQLKPDLIIGNKEENTEDIIVELSKNYPVWVSDIKNVDDANGMIESVGNMLGKTDDANRLVSLIKKKWLPISNKFNGIDVLYLIWKKPYMAVGPNTYIDSVLRYLGFDNVISESRYPTLKDDIHELSPDVVLLSSEPYPFKEAHVHEIQSLFPGALVQLVNGEMFSWYVPRMVKAAEYFDQLTFNFES